MIDTLYMFTYIELWQKETILKKSLNLTTFNETVPKGNFILRWEKVLAMRIFANKIYLS